MDNALLKKFIIGLVLPALIILAAAKINIWLGIAAFLVYISIVAFFSRATIYSLIGSRRYALGKTDEAIRWFKRAHETKLAGTRISVSYAYLLLKNAELEKAEKILQNALKSNGSKQEEQYIKSILALVLWKKGELDAATNMLEEVIKTYKTTSVYGSLGYLLILKGDLEKALQFNLEAYDYNSSDNIICDNLGQNYYLLGMYDKAKDIYEPLMAKNPSFPEPYYNYGLVLYKLGEPEKALESMKKALEYKFSYLSTITREEIEAKIREVEASLKRVN